MAWTPPYNLLGLTVSGDVGDVTIYTDKKGRKVAYAKAPPRKPITPSQLAWRLRFAQAAAAWTALLNVEKARYEECSRILSLPLTGYNLWLSLSIRNDRHTWLTLCHQSRLPLALPLFAP